MATITQLFKIISSNDYETLDKLILSKKLINFNCVKSGYSLVSKAIEVRSKECFNILLNLPNLEIIKNKSSKLSGLSILLEYYLQAPNQSN